MKKLLFGLILILFDIALFLMNNIGGVDFNDFFEVLTILLPFFGLAIAAFGLFDKEDK